MVRECGGSGGGAFVGIGGFVGGGWQRRQQGCGEEGGAVVQHGGRGRGGGRMLVDVLF